MCREKSCGEELCGTKTCAKAIFGASACCAGEIFRHQVSRRCGDEGVLAPCVLASKAPDLPRGPGFPHGEFLQDLYVITRLLEEKNQKASVGVKASDVAENVRGKGKEDVVRVLTDDQVKRFSGFFLTLGLTMVWSTRTPSGSRIWAGQGFISSPSRIISGGGIAIS